MIRKILLVMTMATMSVGIGCGGGVRDEAGADQPSSGTAFHQCSGNGSKVFGGQCYVVGNRTASSIYIYPWNPCPPSAPFQYCTPYGNCFCSS